MKSLKVFLGVCLIVALILFGVFWKRVFGTRTPHLEVHRVPFFSSYVHLTDQGEVCGLNETTENHCRFTVWKPGEKPIVHEIPIEHLESAFINDRKEIVGNSWSVSKGNVFYWSFDTGLLTWTTKDFRSRMTIEAKPDSVAFSDQLLRLDALKMPVKIVGINANSEVLVWVTDYTSQPRTMLLRGFPDRFETTEILNGLVACSFASNGWPFGRERIIVDPHKSMAYSTIYGDLVIFDGVREISMGKTYRPGFHLTPEEFASRSDWIWSLTSIWKNTLLTNEENGAIYRAPEGAAHHAGWALLKGKTEGIWWRLFGGWLENRRNRTPLETRIFRSLRPKDVWVYCGDGMVWELDALVDTPIAKNIHQVLSVNSRGDVLLECLDDSGNHLDLISPDVSQ